MLGRQISERGLRLETIPHRKKGLRERTGTLGESQLSPWLGWPLEEVGGREHPP